MPGANPFLPKHLTQSLSGRPSIGEKTYRSTPLAERGHHEVTIKLGIARRDLRWSPFAEAQQHHTDTRLGHEVVAAKVVKDLHLKPGMQHHREERLARHSKTALGGLALEEEEGLLGRIRIASQLGDDLGRAAERDVREYLIRCRRKRQAKEIRLIDQDRIDGG